MYRRRRGTERSRSHVIPAKAGIHAEDHPPHWRARDIHNMDSGLCRNDTVGGEGQRARQPQAGEPLSEYCREYRPLSAVSTS